MLAQPAKGAVRPTHGSARVVAARARACRVAGAARSTAIAAPEARVIARRAGRWEAAPRPQEPARVGAAEVAEAMAVQVAAARARLRARRARARLRARRVCPPSALCTVSCATCPAIAVTACRAMAAFACPWSSDVIEGAPLGGRARVVSPPLGGRGAGRRRCPDRPCVAFP